MKILLDWNCEELDRGERGSLSKAKYEIDPDTRKIEFLEWENKINFEDILKLSEKIKKLENGKKI